MIKIGVLAQIGQVSIRTLRHYDDLGLLRPVLVDEWSGYRYCSLEQLPRPNRILALKDLGFPLEQVGTLLNSRMTTEQIRGMLCHRQAELARHIAEERARLARVEARLTQIEPEGTMSTYDVVLKRVEPQLVASVHDTIPDWEQVTPILNRLFDEVMTYAAQRGGQITGAPFDRWLDPGMRQSHMHVEACAPVGAAIPESDRVKVYQMEGADTMATTVLHGPLTQLGQAHEAVLRWAEGNGYQIAGPGREVYLQYERDGSSADYVTEIQYPVTKG